MKVGLPRALLFYYYYPLWQEFFRYLDAETLTSEITSHAIVDTGVRYAVAEICVPIKIFCGHAAALLATDVDYIFVPRMITVEKNKYFCPKFLGLPDMVRHLLPPIATRLLAPDIRCKKESIHDLADYDQFSVPLGVSHREVRKALNKAKERWELFRRYHRQGMTIDEALARMAGKAPAPRPPVAANGKLTIGLLGYVYNIYDPFVGMDIINKLRAMDADVVTFEMLDDGALAENLRPLRKAKSMPWTFTNKLFGAGSNFFSDPAIDGLIHLTAFGCGPDSMLGKLLELESVEHDKPFMTIRVDEHTGEAHLVTRIEAFIDMLRRKKFPSP